jgi:hypothetical protein
VPFRHEESQKWHSFPQAPQFSFCDRLTQEPEQQPSPALQELPQDPQFVSLNMMFWQAPLQRTSCREQGLPITGVSSVHLPMTHCPFPQSVPQLPQLRSSCMRSVSVPLQETGRDGVLAAGGLKSDPRNAAMAERMSPAGAVPAGAIVGGRVTGVLRAGRGGAVVAAGTGAVVTARTAAGSVLMTGLTGTAVVLIRTPVTMTVTGVVAGAGRT